jgi:hypothetical protein
MLHPDTRAYIRILISMEISWLDGALEVLFSGEIFQVGDLENPKSVMMCIKPG